MNKVECVVRVEQGQIKLWSRQWFASQLKQLKDGDYSLTLKTKGRRSNRQNSYYWAVVVPMIAEELRELGNDVSDELTHEYLKGRFNKTELVGAGGEYLGDVSDSTTKLNKEEFAQYVDKCVQFAAETLGVTIPPPNTQTELQFMNL